MQVTKTPEPLPEEQVWPVCTEQGGFFLHAFLGFGPTDMPMDYKQLILAKANDYHFVRDSARLVYGRRSERDYDRQAYWCLVASYIGSYPTTEGFRALFEGIAAGFNLAKKLYDMKPVRRLG